MENKTEKSFFVIIALLAITIAVLLLQSPPELADDTAPLLHLPDKLDNYTVDSILFCQNESCMSSCLGKNVVSNSCPACSGTLASMSVGEKQLLGDDTTLDRKIYYTSAGSQYVVSIVTSGREGTSIHTPQTCLKGQGYNILNQYRREINLNDRKPLKVMALDLKKESRTTVDGRYFLYAYWFVSGEHETPYNIMRILLMARDSLFRGISRRWAYISIMTVKSSGTDNEEQLLCDLISRLYPELTRHMPESATF